MGHFSVFSWVKDLCSYQTVRPTRPCSVPPDYPFTLGQLTNNGSLKLPPEADWRRREISSLSASETFTQRRVQMQTALWMGLVSLWRIQNEGQSQLWAITHLFKAFKKKDVATPWLAGREMPRAASTPQSGFSRPTLSTGDLNRLQLVHSDFLKISPKHRQQFLNNRTATALIIQFES